MTPCSPQEKKDHASRNKTKQVDTYTYAHLLRQKQWKKKPVSNYCLSTTHRCYDVRTDVLIFWESILHFNVLCHLIKLIRLSVWRQNRLAEMQHCGFALLAHCVRTVLLKQYSIKHN